MIRSNEFANPRAINVGNFFGVKNNPFLALRKKFIHQLVQRVYVFPVDKAPF
jgi:hypothetical protein